MNDSTSQEQTIKCGVPQGSILGLCWGPPLLLSINSNDLSTSVSCKMIMYADDTMLIIADKNVSRISEQLSKEVANCHQWITNNRLSMHMGKMETIVFSSRKKKHLVQDFELKCQEHIVKPLSKVKYLGLYLDQHLSSDVSVSSIVKKCNNRLKFMYRYSKSLNE